MKALSLITLALGFFLLASCEKELQPIETLPAEEPQEMTLVYSGVRMDTSMQIWYDEGGKENVACSGYHAQQNYRSQPCRIEVTVVGENNKTVRIRELTENAIIDLEIPKDELCSFYQIDGDNEQLEIVRGQMRGSDSLEMTWDTAKEVGCNTDHSYSHYYLKKVN